MLGVGISSRAECSQLVAELQRIYNTSSACSPHDGEDVF